MYKIITFLLVSVSAFCQMYTEIPAATMPIFKDIRHYAKIEILSNGDTVLISTLKHTNGSDYKELIIKGTHLYKNSSFSNQTIYIDGLTTVGSIQYDLLSNIVKFSSDNFQSEIEVLPDSFICNGVKFINLNKMLGVKQKGYFERYFKDDFTEIYKLNTVKYFQNFEYKPNRENISNYYGFYKQSFSLYSLVDNRLKLIKIGNKFMDQFGPFKPDIEWFIDAKNLKTNNEKDIKEIMKYYSYLVSK